MIAHLRRVAVKKSVRKGEEFEKSKRFGGTAYFPDVQQNEIFPIACPETRGSMKLRQIPGALGGLTNQISETGGYTGHMA